MGFLLSICPACSIMSNAWVPKSGHYWADEAEVPAAPDAAAPVPPTAPPAPPTAPSAALLVVPTTPPAAPSDAGSAAVAPAAVTTVAAAPADEAPPALVADAALAAAAPSALEEAEFAAAEFARYCEEQAEQMPIVYWYSPVTIPRASTLIFGDPDLYAVICDFCRCMMNLVVENGRVVRTLCDSCRTVVSRHESNHCPNVSGDICNVYRFVDEVGAVAPLCRGCHQYEEGERRRLREGQKHRKGRAGRVISVV